MTETATAGENNIHPLITRGCSFSGIENNYIFSPEIAAVCLPVQKTSSLSLRTSAHTGVAIYTAFLRLPRSLRSLAMTRRERAVCLPVQKISSLSLRTSAHTGVAIYTAFLRLPRSLRSLAMTRRERAVCLPERKYDRLRRQVEYSIRNVRIAKPIRTFYPYLPGPAVSAPSPVSPSRLAASSRILYLRILPAAFMGKLSTNSMYLGTLWRAILALM